jgi:hypothetical protein
MMLAGLFKSLFRGWCASELFSMTLKSERSIRVSADGKTSGRATGCSSLDCLTGLIGKFQGLLPGLDRERAMLQSDGNRRDMAPHAYLPFYTTAEMPNDLLGQVDRMGMEVRRVLSLVLYLCSKAPLRRADVS